MPEEVVIYQWNLLFQVASSRCKLPHHNFYFFPLHYLPGVTAECTHSLPVMTQCVWGTWFSRPADMWSKHWGFDLNVKLLIQTGQSDLEIVRVHTTSWNCSRKLRKLAVSLCFFKQRWIITWLDQYIRKSYRNERWVQQDGNYIQFSFISVEIGTLARKRLCVTHVTSWFHETNQPTNKIGKKSTSSCRSMIMTHWLLAV